MANQPDKLTGELGGVADHFLRRDAAVQAAPDVLGRTPTASEHQLQLRGVAVARDHGITRVGIARLDPVHARAHAEYPDVASKAEPGLDLLVADGPDRVLESLLGFALDLAKARPQEP